MSTSVTAEVVILSGPPGAGKSTVAAPLARTYARGVHLHTDDYWHSIVSGGIAPYLPESHAQNETVMRVIAATARDYARGYTVVVDGIVGPWMLQHFRALLATDPHVRVHYLVLRPSRREAIARAQRRTGDNDLVDEKPVVSLWQQFAGLREYESHVIDTTSHAVEQTLASIHDRISDASSALEP